MLGIAAVYAAAMWYVFNIPVMGLEVIAVVFALIMMTQSNIITTMDWVYVLCATIGNLFIALKKTDAWVFWLVTDLIGIPLFLLTGSWMYLLMTVFMVIIEIGALKSWTIKAENKK